MPKLRCPLGDFEAERPRTEDAALLLAHHLFDQHCDANPDDSFEQEMAELSGDAELSLKDVATDISARGNIDVANVQADVRADVETRGPS